MMGRSRLSHHKQIHDIQQTSASPDAPKLLHVFDWRDISLDEACLAGADCSAGAG